MNLYRLIGNTPLVEIKNINPNKDVTIYAKLEGQNPGGSVKDRAAYGMIKGAFDRGDISGTSHLVEATSGNTGIALAMIAQAFGVKITLLMPSSATPERVKTMKAYGANVLLTPAEETIEGSRKLAQEMSNSGEYFMLNQFGNQDNPLMHYKTTGPEIWKDTKGKITHFVSAMGTTGTIMGVSKYLKEQNDQVIIVGTQPKEGDRIPGIRRWSPEYLPKFYEPERVDNIVEVSSIQATNITRRLSSEESIMAGMSSGGAMAAALQTAENLDHGIIVTIVCDRGDRYLSSELFL